MSSMSTRAARLVLLVAVVAIGLSTLSCSPPTNWTDLRSLDDLKDAFNRDQGQVRLVLILSPT